MRNSLVMQFRCSECGGNMDLSYDDTKQAINHNNYDNSITGALKVHSFITVHPCQYCYNKAKAPVLMIKEVINAIKDV